jgi:OOP family OmpA-OmpF porin
MIDANKMELAKQALDRVNAAVPALDYSAGLYTFAPYGAVVEQGATVAGAAAGVAELVDDEAIFARLTPMGAGILDHSDVIAKMPKKAAVILVSDGESNQGVDPVAEARAVYDANPDVCFHIISLADTAEGKATLDKIAALFSCCVSVDAADLVANDAAVDKFVGDVFCMDKEEEIVVLRGVNFAFNSTEIAAPARAILDEAAAYLKDKEGYKLGLLGYTDHVGSDAYNLGLSQRRADAVKAYLVKNGVAADAVTARGMGKSFTYDNATADGRAMNRRCELVYEK